VSKARLVITAVVIEGRSQSEVARTYGVSQPWFSRLVARYRAEGEAAFEPQSRRPRRSPSSVPPEVVALVVEIRKDLEQRGLDAGARTIARTLGRQHATSISIATVHRVLVRQGLVTAQPKKQPRSSYIRFESDLPNECWQSDFTHYRFDDKAGTDVEILTFLDDHSRLVLDLTAHLHVTGPIVLAAFRRATKAHGVPASTLTDNGLVFTARFAGGKGGRNGFETELQRLG
jgi:transposase InsO family protein